MSRQTFAQIVFSCIVWLAAGENVAFCQSESGPVETVQSQDAVPAEKAKVTAQGLGQLIIRDAQSSTWQRLSVARFHVNVVISAPVALVQIDETFYNPYDGQEEGTFVLNLPRDASVCRFAMYRTPTQLIEGQLVERCKLPDSREHAACPQQVPAILSQIGDNLFRMQVSPVPGQAVKRVLVDYTVPLERAMDGTYQFSLPLRNDLEPVWDFRIGGQIVGPVLPESVGCPSHRELIVYEQVAADARGNGWDAEVFGGPAIPFELVQHAYEPDVPLRLRFRHDSQGTATLQTYRTESLRTTQPHSEQGSDPEGQVPFTYFRIELPPSALDAQATAPLDLLVLADTSGVVRERPEVDEVVERLIDHLRPEDRVRLVCVDVVARPVHDGWLSPESAELAAAHKRFAGEFRLGGIDLVGSLREAIGPLAPVEAGRRRLAVYVGSGQDTLGAGTENQLVQTLVRLLDKAGAALMTMHVSTPEEVAGRLSLIRSTEAVFDGEVLEAVSRATGGLTWHWWDPAGQRACQRWLDRGMPTPVRIAEVRIPGAKPEDVLFPSAWMPGEPLGLLGRIPTELAKDRIEVHVTTEFDGAATERHESLAVDRKCNNMLVARLWARQKLCQLARKLPAGGWEHEGQVARLCREWSILSPLMTFMLFDSEGDLSRWGVDRLRRCYWQGSEMAEVAPMPKAWRERLTAARQRIADRPQTGKDNTERRAGAVVEVRHRALVEGLGWQRVLFLPTAEMQYLRQPSPSLLFGPSIEPDKDYERMFPQYRAMLTPMDISTPRLTLHEFADLLSERAGVRVAIDRKALEDVGLASDVKVGGKDVVLGRGSISLYNYARHVLGRVSLVIVPDADGLCITSWEEAEERLQTHIYPAADLILSGSRTPHGLLMDPVFDAERAAEERVRKRLLRPISLDVKETPLTDVLMEVGILLDVPLVIEDRDLRDVGFDPKSPVSIRCQDMPGDAVLRRLLHPLHLGFDYYMGAVTVASWGEPECCLDSLRFYSVKDVVYEHIALPSLNESAPAKSADAVQMAGEFLGGKAPNALMRRIPISAGGEMLRGMVEEPRARDKGQATACSGRSAVEVPLPDTRFGRIDNIGWHGEGSVNEPRYEADFGAITESITSTIAPQTWERNDGSGSIIAWPFSLDLVVYQAGYIHDEVEELLEALRGLPLAAEGHPAMRPARVPQIEYLTRRDLEQVVELLEKSISPQTWSEVGGPGESVVDLPHGAIVVSQTQSMHRKLRHFLTQLRRRRYELLWGDRPWEVGGTNVSPRIDPWGVGAMMGRLQPARLPLPEPAELDALKWRQLPERGQWVWRRMNADGKQLETITLVQDGARLEVRLPECSIRIEGEQVAVAWPELGLVELGPWAEAIRCVLDQRLPWLPHRSNENLARWYDALPASAAVGTANQEKPATRLIPPGYTALGGTYLLIEPSGAEHLPGQVTSFVDKEPTGRLRWAEDNGGEPAIFWENAAGGLLVRWELVEHVAEPPAVPSLAEPRTGFVLLDRRDPAEREPCALTDALAALEGHNWPAATARLAEVAEDNPGHPLVVVLQAWCHGQASERESADGRLADLEAAMAAGHSLVFDWLAEGHPIWLDPIQRYHILREYSKRSQTWDSTRVVVMAAFRAAQYEEALKLVKEAIAAGLGADDRAACFDQQRIRINLLLKQGWFLEAEAAALMWGQRDDAISEELTALAENLIEGGRREVAANLLGQAVAVEATAERKARLLRRMGDLDIGLPRWERLVEAIALLPDDSPERQQWAGTLCAELMGSVHADIPAQLAEKTHDEALRAWLRMIYADQLADMRAVREVLWELAEKGQLPAQRLQWGMGLWNRSKHPERTIAVWERELRQGRVLHPELLPLLRDAYLAADRPIDARRADTEP